ncbi:hypothetical protein EML15_02410 [Corynebacterium sp. sy017]|uniref:hypothetical protein n=1 Tax=unclassified Corynebacterium TaxID=2624378 RepID=UPI0011861ADE|nr:MULTISPECIES: hypothetical protein [unclassified Corynebacterium]MBP3088011.1 hypothetical protein [Corynebacterium sp. sy017]TSD92541.1 hypothetical protein ELY17_02410 [Corynebacterium sp. SY003]
MGQKNYAPLSEEEDRIEWTLKNPEGKYAKAENVTFDKNGKPKVGKHGEFLTREEYISQGSYIPTKLDSAFAVYDGFYYTVEEIAKEGASADDKRFIKRTSPAFGAIGAGASTLADMPEGRDTREAIVINGVGTGASALVLKVAETMAEAEIISGGTATPIVVIGVLSIGIGFWLLR